MMRKILFFILVFIVLCPVGLRGQVADSVDVEDYDLSFEFSGGTSMRGYADITLRLLRECPTVTLMLQATTDSVKLNGTLLPGVNLNALPTAGLAVGEVAHVEVWYHAMGYVEPGNWGGLHLSHTMSYNLGVGFLSNPHVLGRALFPCRDNFTDKATYTLRLTTRAGLTAECSGVRQSVSVDSLGREHSVWRIAQPTPTYLVSVSEAPWQRVYDTVSSLYGNYPLTLGYRSGTEQQVRQAFAELDSVVPMFERCFGPYRWGRIGYIATPKGSMEHVNNIALVSSFATSLSERAQSTIAHELGHAWFGNLVTCTTDGDMWINEGGASFCSEVAMESVLGREASDDYYQRNLESVLRTTHLTDEGYRSLHDMPFAYAYGSTTYDKGWMVWHSLRGYLGEEAFYAAVRRLMERCAFGNIDAAGVRDSLSLYTGVDLTAFFDFHVYGPGFVDYHVEMDAPGEGNQAQEVRVHIRQQGVGTTNTMDRNRVPLTFYARPGADTAVCKRVAVFDGEEAWVDFSLPFVPAYCVLDADCEFSDAATVGAALLTAGEEQVLATQHFAATASESLKLHVEHHWAPAASIAEEGLARQASRYWMLRGAWGTESGLTAKFRFVRSGNTRSTYNHLDDGFYTTTASVDSLAVYYRANGSSPWRLLQARREGSADEGFLAVDHALPGEYTLAIVDTALLAIAAPAMRHVDLFPNPLGPGQGLTVEVESDEEFSVTIVDMEGRQVWRKTGCHSGENLHPALAKGTYFVRIENNFISLQSKLIQL